MRGVYRTKEEVDEWKNNNDPIDKYRDYLVAENIASAEKGIEPSKAKLRQRD